MSNVLAAIGRAQLKVLEERVAARRRNFAFYQQALGSIPGLCFMPEAPYGQSSRWLSVMQVDPCEFGATAEDVRRHLEQANVESRPVWKPLHLQPLFRACRHAGGAVAECLFRHGLCLPSGSSLSEGDLTRVVDAVMTTPRRAVTIAMGQGVAGPWAT
jgi:dTDP-4-amino-4,6-dideoxygalactose transaminase